MRDKVREYYLVCILACLISVIVASIVFSNEITMLRNKVERLNAYIDRQEQIIETMEEFNNVEK